MGTVYSTLLHITGLLKHSLPTITHPRPPPPPPPPHLHPPHVQAHEQITSMWKELESLRKKLDGPSPTSGVSGAQLKCNILLFSSFFLLPLLFFLSSSSLLSFPFSPLTHPPLPHHKTEKPALLTFNDPCFPVRKVGMYILECSTLVTHLHATVDHVPSLTLPPLPP